MHHLQSFSLPLPVRSWCGVVGADLPKPASGEWMEKRGWRPHARPCEKKERFNRRLTGGFFARPFLGLVAGVLVLTGAHFGLLASVVARDQYATVFLCLLGGLFSKTLFDWLRDTFKKILGMK